MPYFISNPSKAGTQIHGCSGPRQPSSQAAAGKKIPPAGTDITVTLRLPPFDRPAMIDLLLRWFWKLPRPLFGISRSLDQQGAMRYGVVLLADVYSPRGAANAPTVLIRSPYGRGSLFGPMAR